MAYIFSSSSANVANSLTAISDLLGIYDLGGISLTGAQVIAFQNTQALLQSQPGGFNSYQLTATQELDMYTVYGVVGLASSGTGLASTYGPTLTYEQNQASAGSLNQITDDNFPTSANTITYNDTYFLVDSPGTGFFNMSNTADATAWNPLANVSVEAVASTVIAVSQLGGYVVAFTPISMQWFQDQGTYPLAYVNIFGTTSDVGLAAIWSLQQFMGSLIFMGSPAEGPPHIYMIMNGYEPIPISTPDIDYILSQSVNPGAALSQAYIVDGHSMYELTLPYDNITLLYDGLTKVWSHLKSGVGPTLGRHRTQFSCTFNFLTVCSDASSGMIYFLDSTNNTEDGFTFVRSIKTKHLSMDGNMFGVDQLYLDMNTGQGLVTNSSSYANGAGQYPSLTLRVSKDYGRTFPYERYSPLYPQGQYCSRVGFRRLGMARDFVFEFYLTDPVPFEIDSVYIKTRQGSETS